jgi:hypothetical protein
MKLKRKTCKMSESYYYKTWQRSVEDLEEQLYVEGAIEDSVKSTKESTVILIFNTLNLLFYIFHI